MFQRVAETQSERQHRARAVHTSEGTGIVLIAFLLLILALNRHGRLAAGSWR